MPKVAKKSVKEKSETRTTDVPWNDKKVALFKALRHSSLTGGEGPPTQLSELTKGKVSPRDVRHYGFCASLAGLIKLHRASGDGDGAEGSVRTYSLTAAGRKIDPEAAFKAQQEARKTKPTAKVEKAPKAKKKTPKKAKAAKTEATPETAAA